MLSTALRPIGILTSKELDSAAVILKVKIMAFLTAAEITLLYAFRWSRGVRQEPNGQRKRGNSDSERKKRHDPFSARFRFKLPSCTHIGKTRTKRIDFLDGDTLISNSSLADDQLLGNPASNGFPATARLKSGSFRRLNGRMTQMVLRHLREGAVPCAGCNA
jgi:hypothetical protein